LVNEPEPAITPDDTNPRKPVSAIDEPPITQEDTHPRPLAAEEPVSGCRNPLLVVAVGLAFACLFVSSVGLAGYAGWRDGAEFAQTKKSGTLVSYLGNQATLARVDCDEGRYELCNERCKYVATQQPSFPGMASCMTLAQLVLSATPTPSAIPTIAPTPTQTPTQPPNTGGLPSPEELFARSQEAIRTEDYENAMKWLEALRGRDADFRRKDVEDMLVKTYLALAGRYKLEKRFSEMIIVVKKAAKIRSLAETDWEFTADVAQRYLDAKAALDAQNYALANRGFAWLIENAPAWEDTKELACQAFQASGDTAQFKKYCS
jgi:hypothetical protein